MNPPSPWLRFVLICILPTIPGAKAESVTVVSLPAAQQTAAAGGSFNPAFSADGRHLVFTSHAANLATNAHDSLSLGVCAHDLVLHRTTLVSVSDSGAFWADQDAVSPSVSSNGQFVAFASAAGNLVPGDTNNQSDIFVRDLISGTTRLVSVPMPIPVPFPAPPYTNSPLCGNPIISGNGRWIAFESLAANLVEINDANQTADIFVRDCQDAVTELITVNAAGTGTANGPSELAGLTSDGRFVLFISRASDLAATAANTLGEVYVRDRQSGVTCWASTNAATLFAEATNGLRSLNPAISSDGRIVIYQAGAPQATTALLIRHELQTGASSVIHTNTSIFSPPQLSADGRFAAYEAEGAVYVWDDQWGSNTLVSVNLAGNGTANASSSLPVMAPDGTVIAFTSAASDLVAEATNGVAQIFVRDLNLAVTKLVTVKLSGAPSDYDSSTFVSAIRGDGEWLAFESRDGSLVAGDGNGAGDIFVRDLQSGTTDLISRQHPGREAQTGPALASVSRNSITADGRQVLFTSLDQGQVPGDTNVWPDLFLRIVAGGILPVSADTNGVFDSSHHSIDGVISANGRYAAFAQKSGQLTSNRGRILLRDLWNGTIVEITDDARGNPIDPTNPFTSHDFPLSFSADGKLLAFQAMGPSAISVYVYDTQTRTQTLLSTNALGVPNRSDAIKPLLSPDGRWLLFESTAALTTNVVENSYSRIFGYDLTGGRTFLVSKSASGDPLPANSVDAIIAANSRTVAFVNRDFDWRIYVYDLIADTNTLVSEGATAPALSGDGRRIVFQETSAQSGRPLKMIDFQSGTTNLISVNRFGTNSGRFSASPTLVTYDGRFVVFSSLASDLVENDTNNMADIFVRDTLLETTLVLSLNRTGTAPGNLATAAPVLGADGRTVVFQSFASDLVEGDYNDTGDVFLLRLGSEDSDGDGLEDDWEFASFGTLDRDGSGDFDSDGHTDEEEYRAGTNPANDASILRVLTLTRVGGGATTVLWSAVPGKTYRVQYKDALSDADWSDLPGDVTATSSTASAVDPSAGASEKRFYRVLVLAN